MDTKIFAVQYVYHPERSEEVARVRPDHRMFLRELYERGDLLASGPTDNGKALIIVRAQDSHGALELLDADPMRIANVIVERSAHAWNPVIGPWA